MNLGFVIFRLRSKSKQLEERGSLLFYILKYYFIVRKINMKIYLQLNLLWRMIWIILHISCNIHMYIISVEKFSAQPILGRELRQELFSTPCMHMHSHTCISFLFNIFNPITMMTIVFWLRTSILDSFHC